MSDTELPPAKRLKIDHEVTVKHEEPCSSNEPIKSPEICSDQEYEENFVTAEEVAKLREFQVLDEVKSNDEDSQAEEDSTDSSDGEPVLPDEEIEKMLEEDLPEDFKAAPKPKEKPYITREKVILEEKGVNHFEVLPLDWIMIRHQSGMPVYVHRSTRVCTLAKPYFLGKGNAKRHEIPISAIPCLAYRRALEEEEKQKEIDKKIEQHIKQGYFTAPVTETCKKTTGKGFFPDNIQITDHRILNLDGNNSEPREQKQQDEVEDKKVASKQQDEVEDKKVTSKQQDEVEDKKVATKCPFKAAVSEKKESHEELSDDHSPIFSEEPDRDVKGACPFKKTETDDQKNENTDERSETEAAASGSESNILSDIPASRQPVVLPGGLVMAAPRVETVRTSWKSQHLSYDQVYEYCNKLFKFKVLNIMHFKRWADRRKYTKARKALQYPMLPEGTKLITIPAQPTAGENSGSKSTKRDWVMNMNGRSYLSVFHEYVRRALQKQPVYEFKQLENAATPYQATVFIGGMQYGVGHGSSKRQAKSAAARASIQILIPEMRDHLEPDNDAEPDFVFFDYVGIEDPRIAEFCAATCEPTPHAILRTCLLRNFGAGDRHIHVEMKKLEYQKIELTMKVGKHSATVVCKNKKTAKQRASQAILQALHPHVRSWGSLLRLYGSRSVKSCKERKLEEQQITLLQDKARRNEPNRAVLDKLRHEMGRLRARDAALAPLGTLLTAALPLHSGSNLNNVRL